MNDRLANTAGAAGTPKVADSPPVPASSTDIEIEALGQRIGELRKAAGWRLADLADATGYTTSYLSQIECGVSIPSLSALAAVALALGVEMAALVDNFKGPRVDVTRASEGIHLGLGDGRWRRIIGRLDAGRAFTAVTQNLDSRPSSHRHFGERFVIVLSGSIRISFGSEHHDLGPLETIHYGAHEEHTVQAMSDDEPEMLFLSLPALF